MTPARRGDGGARELARIFGVASETLGELAADETAKRNAKFAEDGARDQINGAVDPKKAKRHRAYQVAASSGQAVTDYNEHHVRQSEAVVAMLNDRDNPATVEAINDYLEQTNREFLLNPDGNPRDFGSPEAARRVLALAVADRPKLLETAAKAIGAQAREKANNNALSNVVAMVGRGEVPNIEEGIAQLLPDSDIPAFRRSAINAIASALDASIPDDVGEAAALGIEEFSRRVTAAKTIIDGLIKSSRVTSADPSGTSRTIPSFSLEEISELRDYRLRLSGQTEALAARVTAKLQDDNGDKFLDRTNGVGGAYPSIREVQAARAAGSISSEKANQIIGIIEADRRQAEADAERAARKSRGDDDDDDDSSVSGGGAFGDSLLAAVYSGEVPANKAKDAVVRAAAKGYFGGGKGRKKKMTAIMEELGKIQSGRQEFTETSDFRRELTPFTYTVNRLRQMTRSGPPSQRLKAQKWLQDYSDRATVNFGKAYTENGGDMEARAASVGRSLDSSFQKNFPGLYRR